MTGTVIDITGDYAIVRYDNTGTESQVALALLPYDIDIGDRIKYENFEYDRV